jgi:hypothetical protein
MNNPKRSPEEKARQRQLLADVEHREWRDSKQKRKAEKEAAEKDKNPASFN